MLEAQGAPSAYETTALAGTSALAGTTALAGTSALAGTTALAGADAAFGPPQALSGPAASALPRQNAFPSQILNPFENKTQRALNLFETQAAARVVPLDSEPQPEPCAAASAMSDPAGPGSDFNLPPALFGFDKNTNASPWGLPDAQPPAPAVKAAPEMMSPPPAALPGMPPKALGQSPMFPSRQPGLRSQAFLNRNQPTGGKSVFPPRPLTALSAARPQESKPAFENLISAPQAGRRAAAASVMSDPTGAGRGFNRSRASIEAPPAMARNSPDPGIAPVKAEIPPPPPKKFIPTSWTAPLPAEAFIDGQVIPPSVYDDDPAYAQEAYAAPLPLDVQRRFDDRQVVTVELYDGPVVDKNEEKDSPLIFSPIELDENQGLDRAAGFQAAALEIKPSKDGAFKDALSLFEDKVDSTVEPNGLSSDSSCLFAYRSDAAARAASISIVSRLPLTETEALKIGAVEGRGRRAMKPKALMPKRAPQFSPPGVRPPMFPRSPVAPDNLVAPEFIVEYAPKGPGPLVKAALVGGRAIYRAFRSVSVAAYWFFKRRLDKTPRPVLTSSAACLLIGMLAGAWILYAKSSEEIKDLKAAVSHGQELLQSKQSGKIESLYKERDRLSGDLLRVAAISREYPEGSIPRALAMAASEEFKIADALLLQQIAAIESGAKVTVAVKQTTPDLNLASTLEEEMGRLQNDIDRQAQATRNLGPGPKMLADAGVATQALSLAILNRNHLIAKYGLSSPFPAQYQLGAYADGLERKMAQAGSEEPGFSNDQLPGLLDELRQEAERLRAENELLLNSDSTLYASAVTDMGVGRLTSARDKFSKLLKVYPSSNLAPKTHEGLAQIKVMTAQKEAAKKPPVQVSYTSVRHDGGYFKNETYVRVSFRNVSDMMIKRMEFQVLTFDEHGYPVGSKRLGMTDDNALSAVMAENVASGKTDYGVWELSDKVRQVKVKLKEVEFYEAPIWRDEDIDRWVEKESARFVQANGKNS